MRFARTTRTAAVVAALAATGALALPATAHAEPAAPTTSTTQPDAPATSTAPTEGETPTEGEDPAEQTIPLPTEEPDVDPAVLQSLGTFAPALIGSIATRGADGEVNTELLDQARTLADNPAVPEQAREVWNDLLDFLGEPGRKQAVAAGAVPLAKRDAAERKGGPAIPTGPGAPKIQQFLYPTIGIGCMPDGGNSVGMALTTAGPQAAPAPGPKRGQAGFVYTSLGTGPAVDTKRKLWVSWLNLENGRTGQTALKRNAKINAADGPGTFTGIAKTGRGRIVAAIYGDVSTKGKNGRTVSCTIAPTIGTAII